MVHGVQRRKAPWLNSEVEGYEEEMLDPTVTYHNKNIMTLLKVCHVISRNGFEQWETA